MPTPLDLTLLLLATAVIGVVLFRFLHLPPMLGYLSVGILIGPHALGLVPNLKSTSYLAEFGVVFLMFSIGLEFSLPKLKSMKRQVFGLGASQVLLTMLLAVPASLALRFAYPLSWQAALALGGALSMSSTAIVSKILSERLELETEHGRNIVSVLLFQDLAVVLLLILVPSLGKNPTDLVVALSIALVKVALALALILFLGHKLMSRWFHIVAARRSQELFMLNLLLITLGMGALTEHLGLSMALGAFLAGMLISETPYRHQVEEDIKPFRDVLLGLFFVTIGMLLNIKVVAENLPLVLFLLMGPVLLKFALITGLARAFGSSAGVAIRTGLGLAQAGEFGFVLLRQIDGMDLVDPVLSQAILAAMLLSMLAAPFLILYSDRIAMRFSSSEWLLQSLAMTKIAAQTLQTEKHAIICGYGRTGQSLARMLEQENLPYVALDLDPDRVQAATDAGESVVYGDAGRRESLAAAGIDRAELVVVTYADTPSALRVLHHVKELAPGVPVIVRTVDDSDLDKLRAAGAAEVVPEIIEGSLMLSSHALVLLGVPMRRVVRRTQQARDARYSMLRGYFHGADDSADDLDDSAHVRLQTVQLPAVGKAIGCTLGELQLQEMGVEVAAIRRAGIRSVAPVAQTLMQGGDVLVLRGLPEALAAAETHLLQT
ncbi:MAG: monovalent cation:proton antiporter-2 (CPA2) family protein [Candidatus Protistobacter heckmanni]|nr:monovalent cation:proton antiporter-2 (CPA2) family protein [Candidatus Protistobacter heckmanni]